MCSSVIPYCLALLISLNILPESPPVKEKKYVSIVIEQDSYLKILGTTNVNTFSCGYQGNISTDTLNINVQRDEDQIWLDDASLSVEVGRFDCGQSGMNKDFRNLLQHEQYPHLKINIMSLSLSTKQAKYEAVAQVSIAIAGEEEFYEVPVKLEAQDGRQYYTGKQVVNIRDFELTPPKKFLGMVVVDEEVVIDFKLNLSLL